MVRHLRDVVLALTVLGFVCPTFAHAENEGRDDLFSATQLKLNTKSLDDLNKVIQLCESALKKGLDKGNKKLAQQVLVSTLFERATGLTRPILDKKPPAPQWIQMRAVALKDLEKIVEIDDTVGHAHYLISRLQLLPGGDVQKAKQEAIRAVQLIQDDDILRAKALVLRAMFTEDKKKRLEDIDQAIKLDPTNIDARRQRGAIFLDQGEPEKALEDFQKALKIEPKNPRLHQVYAEILKRLKKDDQAREHFLKAIELTPKNDAGLLQRAQLKLLVKDVEGSLADINLLLNRHPGLPAILGFRSSLYAALGQFDRAAADLEQLAHRAPKNPKLKTQLAAFNVADQRPRKAIETLTSILAENPKYYPALHSRGDALLSVGRHADAISDFQEALKDKEISDGVLNNLAWVLSTSPKDELRDGKRAIELATKACEITKYEQAHIISTLAASYAESGDFESAVKWSKKAIEVNEKDSQNQRNKDIKEHLANELKSYEQKKPWRELQEVEEKPGPPPANQDDLNLDSDEEEPKVKQPE